MRRKPLTIAVLVLLVAALGALLLSARRGLELTDEAFYVMVITRPAGYPYLAAPFGFFYHPIFELLGHSIVALRWVGTALLASSGAVLGHSLDRYYRARLPEVAPESVSQPLLCALFALVYYVWWFLTPAYNLIADAGASLVLAGLLEWRMPRAHALWSPRHQVFASVAIGVGAWWLFMGKAPAAVVAALVVGVLLILDVRAGRFRDALTRAAIVGASCFVPIYADITASTTLARFVEINRTAMQRMHTSEDSSRLKVYLRDLANAPIAFVIAVTACAIFFASAMSGERSELRRRNERRAATAVLGCAALYLAYALSSVVLRRLLSEKPHAFVALGCPIMTMAIAHLGLGLVQADVTKERLKALAPALALLVIPIVIALGTSNDSLLAQTGISMFAFLTASSIIALVLFPPAAARAQQVGLALLAVAIVAIGYLRPYDFDLSPIGKSEPEALPFSPDRLSVGPTTKRYLDGLLAVAKEDHLDGATPVLDLSGGGPGTVLFLTNNAPGFPWPFPWYGAASSGMVDLFWNALSEDEKRRTWLVGPVHPGYAKSQFVEDLTLHESRYACVAELPMRFWQKTSAYTLWRPVGPDGEADHASAVSPCTPGSALVKRPQALAQ